MPGDGQQDQLAVIPRESGACPPRVERVRVTNGSIITLPPRFQLKSLPNLDCRSGLVLAHLGGPMGVSFGAFSPYGAAPGPGTGGGPGGGGGQSLGGGGGRGPRTGGGGGGGCPSLLTTFDCGLASIQMSAAKSSSLARLIIGDGGGAGLLYNASNDLPIAVLDFSGIPVTSYVPLTDKFCFPNDDTNYGFVLVSAATGVRDPTIITVPYGAACVTSWSADDGGTYTAGASFISPFNTNICKLDAATETVDLSVDLGANPAGGANTCLYVPSPKSLVFDNFSSTTSLDQFSLPGGLLLGSINFDPPALGVGSFKRGLVYAPTTGKIYASAISYVTATYVVYEIDPASFSVTFTYDTGVPTNTGWGYMDYDAVNDRIFVTADTTWFVIHPVTQTMTCPSLVGGSFGTLAFDLKSGRVFAAPLSSSTISVWQ